eukprot:13224711-Ditylum_brightwellii.AAC.1
MLTKLSDIPAEHVNKGVCRNDKVAFFVSCGHVHVQEHDDPGGAMTVMLYARSVARNAATSAATSAARRENEKK